MYTKKELNYIISNIIKGNKLNERINGEDEEKMFEILEKSRSLSYIKKGGYYFFTGNYKLAGSRRVKMLFASNGPRKIPLSKSKIIESIIPTKSRKSKEEKHIATVKIAARNIINTQIKEFRETVELPVVCPLSHKKLYLWRDIHVDHKIPFIKIFNDWLDRINISPLDIKVCGSSNNKTFKQEYLRDSWYNYHLAFSALQCVDAKFNLLESDKY